MLRLVPRVLRSTVVVPQPKVINNQKNTVIREANVVTVIEKPEMYTDLEWNLILTEKCFPGKSEWCDTILEIRRQLGITGPRGD